MTYWQNIALVLFCSTRLNAQNYITNPGFEGQPGIESIPADWFAGCGNINTPDTQPGWWNVENKPYEGDSYINLLYKDDGTTESVYQKLTQPLDSGYCYLVEIHLAQACQDSISGLYPYDFNHPGDLQIRGSESYGCANGQVLAYFEQVNNCYWQTFYAIFQAHETINYVYLEFFKGSSPANNGSVLIDQFVLENLHPLPETFLEPAYAETILLQASAAGVNHIWLSGENILATDTSHLELMISENSIIDLTYFSEDGCLVEQRFKVWVKPKIPNVFTPLDGDTVNDVFHIYGLIENSSLEILNRWGETVFYQAPYLNSWSPKNLTQGVYFYRLNLLDTGRFFEGFVTIF